jgi:hypothetical protein
MKGMDAMKAVIPMEDKINNFLAIWNLSFACFDR